MRVAALDLGTNTFLLLIAEIEKGKIKQVLHDEAQVVRLGQGVHSSKRFHADALMRAEKCLKAYSKIITEFAPARVLAAATSAARDAQNGQALFDLGKKFGIPIEVFTGDQEARVSFEGSVSGLSNDLNRRLIVDVGGGSTEFIFGIGSDFRFGKSVDVGSVRLTDMMSKPPPYSGEELRKMQEIVSKSISPALQQIKNLGELDEIIAVAGTPTELARVMVGGFFPEKINGFSLNTAALQNWLRDFSVRSPEKISKDFGVDPGRSDVILAGSMILLTALEAVKMKSMIVSTRGVRYGVALHIARNGSGDPA